MNPISIVPTYWQQSQVCNNIRAVNMFLAFSLYTCLVLLIVLSLGPNCCVNPAIMDAFLCYEPQATSMKNLIHLAQSKHWARFAKNKKLAVHFSTGSIVSNIYQFFWTVVRSGIISKYDYKNSSENSRRYGQPTPPSYNIKSIPKDFPLFLAYGGSDQLSDVTDVKRLIKDLKRHIKDKLVISYIPNYGHADFVIAENANKVLFEPLMSFFKLQWQTA